MIQHSLVDQTAKAVAHELVDHIMSTAVRIGMKVSLDGIAKIVEDAVRSIPNPAFGQLVLEEARAYIYESGQQT